MTSFLMQYNRRTGHLDVTEFVGDTAREEAMAARVDAEDSRPSPDIEVVVLTANSLDDLKVTHGRYFFTPTELVRNALAAS